LVRVLREIKTPDRVPKGWGMFNTQYKKKPLAVKHAERLKRKYLYTVAIVKTPKGWNVLSKTNKKSLEWLRKDVAKKRRK